MAKSDNLRKAKENKNDEFYTRLEDIETEISEHKDYVRQFEGKTVFCNCDDPEWSNFFVFFKNHFNQLKLKKLITTHYNPDGSPSYKMEWSGEMLNDDMVNLIKTPLKGNGDFRSEECIELLKEADIVVTNPPFSCFREYVAQLVKYNKSFVIIGNNNAIAYKEIFPLLKDGKMFLGYSCNKTCVFRVGDGYTYDKKITEQINDGFKYGKVPAISWFTNLDLDKSHEPLILTKNYYGNEDRYPKYDNYDAIECGKVKDIPKDYFPCWYDCPSADKCPYALSEGKVDSEALCEQPCNGEIGVPITYMVNHCEDQIEIVGSDNDFAKPMSDIAPEGTYTKGGPAFYLKDEKSLDKSETTPIIADDTTRHDTTRHDTTRHDTTRHDTTRHDSIADYTTESLFAEKRRRRCNGIIGVPITYLAEHCADQFRIIWQASGNTRASAPKDALEQLGYKQHKEDRGGCPVINNKRVYTRILIQRKM